MHVEAVINGGEIPSRYALFFIHTFKSVNKKVKLLRYSKKNFFL